MILEPTKQRKQLNQPATRLVVYSLPWDSNLSMQAVLDSFSRIDETTGLVIEINGDEKKIDFVDYIARQAPAKGVN